MDSTATVYQQEETINGRHAARRGQDVDEGVCGVITNRGPRVWGTPRMRINHRV